MKKWVGFILSQILWNCYQYCRAGHPQVKIYTERGLDGSDAVLFDGGGRQWSRYPAGGD